MVDSNAFNPSSDIKFVVKNTSSINRSIKVFQTAIGPGNTLDLMKIPGVSEEDIRSEINRGALGKFLASGALTILSSTVNLSTSDTNHSAFLNSVGLSGNSLGGIEVITVADAGSQGTPAATLSLDKQISIVVNTSGNQAWIRLPDATDGVVKEISNGANNAVATGFCFIACTNNVNNDEIDLNANVSVKMVWVTAFGGWVVVSITNGTSSLWD